jgi:hypothetical protein
MNNSAAPITGHRYALIALTPSSARASKKHPQLIEPSTVDLTAVLRNMFKRLGHGPPIATPSDQAVKLASIAHIAI